MVKASALEAVTQPGQMLGLLTGEPVGLSALGMFARQRNTGACVGIFTFVPTLAERQYHVERTIITAGNMRANGKITCCIDVPVSKPRRRHAKRYSLDSRYDAVQG